MADVQRNLDSKNRDKFTQVSSTIPVYSLDDPNERILIIHAPSISNARNGMHFCCLI